MSEPLPLPAWSKQAATHIHYDADQMRAYAAAAVAAAVAAERERCALLCETLTLNHPGRADLTADQCAAAIRAQK